MSKGFSILELVITLAIVGLISSLAIPNMDSWQAKRSFDNARDDLSRALVFMRAESKIRSTTTRIVITQSDDDYTIEGYYYTDGGDTACDGTGSWTQNYNETIEMHSSFEMTGTGVDDDVCFNRDGTATSAVFNILQKDGNTDLGSVTMTIFLATGFIDIVDN
ncbi:prepilin-type N-terminal cleavage/methylation domain-containing protein [Rickettsiales bacterium]|nr:prepilin-type N-terminal cleavage/methylation domain-containing protein [Rickettsiales bacterium]